MQRQMTQKLGLGVWQDGDETLMDDLWSLMQANHADFTLTFRQLAHAPGVGAADPERVRRDLGGTTGPTVQPFIDLFLDREAAQAWLERYLQRIGSNDAMARNTRLDSMLEANPLYVLRNHLAQKAIEDAQAGDFTEVDRLMRALGSPYAHQAGMDAYAAQPPVWAAKIEVSCSS
jgi:uncharacterized protein YdiU (UPF0061 family)